MAKKTNDSEVFERRLEILMFIAKRTDTTAKDIEDHFIHKIPKRTLLTDLKILRSMEGALVPRLQFDEDRKPIHYRMERNELDVLKKSVNVDEDDLLSLYLIRDANPNLRGTYFEERISALIRKLEDLLPESRKFYDNLDFYRENLGSLRNLDIGAYEYSAENKKVINDLFEAGKNNRKCEITYKSGAGEKTHKILPVQMLYNKGALYLVAIIECFSETTNFLVHNIREIRLLDEVFDRGDKGYKKALRQRGNPSGSFGIYWNSAIKPVQVVIEFSKRVRNRVLNRRWHATQKVVENSDGTVTLTMNVPITIELTSWIMQWGADAKVIEPERLREEMRGIVREMEKNYISCADNEKGKFNN